MLFTGVLKKRCVYSRVRPHRKKTPVSYQAYTENGHVAEGQQRHVGIFGGKDDFSQILGRTFCGLSPYLTISI